MKDPDVLRVRRPGWPVQIIGLLLCFGSFLVLEETISGIWNGGWFSVIFWIICGLQIVSLLYGAWFSVLMALLRWETVIDRRSRTVTRRVRLIWTIKEDHFRFEDFKAVVLLRVGATSPDETNSIFSIVLLGPNVRLDLNNPDQVPFAALFLLLARISASFHPDRQMALATTLVEYTGLKFRDRTGLRKRPKPAPRPPVFRTWPRDQGFPILKITRIPWFIRGLMMFMLVDVLFLAYLTAGKIIRIGLLFQDEGTILLFALILASVALLVLSIQSSVGIDFENRLIERRSSFFWWRRVESFPFDLFEAVLVRETKIPFFKSSARAVFLAQNRFTIWLYHDKTVPRSLRSPVAGLDRGQRCLASAETLAEWCGLPMRVVLTGARSSADFGPMADGEPIG